MPICATSSFPDYHTQFPRPPADPASAFVPLGGAVDLDQLLAEEGERLVGRDNVVSFEGRALQFAKQRGRRSCAGLRVTVRRHLSGAHRCGAVRSAWAGTTPRAGRWTGRAPNSPTPSGPRPGVFRPPAPKNARAHLASEGPRTRGPRSPHPSDRATPRRRRGPRLPVGPGE